MNKNVVKILAVIGIAVVIIIMAHLAGGNLVDMIKNHLGV